MAYEVSHRENIEHLRRRLQGSWRPSPPMKIYLPKASGLQRPLSLLTLEDQIVLQAIANAFAKKLYMRRRAVEKRVVFSNLLNSPMDSIFFMQDWHETYSAFQEKCREHFYSGSHWVAHFDLSAFYDTISHELLLKCVSPRGGNDLTWKKVKMWLGVWCTSVNGHAFQHGIPQGPIASDFIAESLLLPLDEAMLATDVRYVRYVDDIRIFGRSRVEAQTAALRLEESCRELGLVPQGRKFSIEKAKNPKEAMGMLPSMAPPDRIEGGGPVAELDEQEAIDKFSAAISGRPYRITDKSIARYVLYRAPKSEKLLGWVLMLLPRHPEHIDAFASYLANYGRSVRIERSAAEILKSGLPYQYARGELWHILGRVGTLQGCQEMIPLALADLRDPNRQMTLTWGALSFLISCQKRGLGSYAHRIRHQLPLVQALLVPIIPDVEYQKASLITQLLQSRDQLPGIMLAEQLARRDQTHLDYGLKIRTLVPQVQNAFRALGLIRRRVNVNVDQIGEILTDRYGTSIIKKWRIVFAAEYTHALQILLQADALYDAGRSDWLMHQNSFNHALSRAFISFLNSNGLSGRRTLVDTNGKEINYGVLLEAGSPVDANHPDIAGPFREANSRRNTLPGAHPYDQKGGAQNKYLSKLEQTHLRGRLHVAYSSLITYVDQNT